MIQKIKAIGDAIKHECYLPALALTLTLPDICGQVETAQTGRNSYINWYDKYVKPLYYIENYEVTMRQFDGELCYALRCAFLHAGNFDLKKNKEEMNVIFRLHVDMVNGKPIYHNEYWEEEGKNIIDMDVNRLCYLICYAAKEFYYNYKDKSIFEKYESNIVYYSMTEEFVSKFV